MFSLGLENQKGSCRAAVKWSHAVSTNVHNHPPRMTLLSKSVIALILFYSDFEKLPTQAYVLLSLHIIII